MKSILFALVALMAVFLPATTVTAAELHGQVIDAETRLPIEGASIAVKKADGTVSVARQSGGFGFYKIEALVAASYTLEITHPAYEASSEALGVAADSVLTKHTALNPLMDDDGNRIDFIDVYVTATGVKSSYLLEGVPVRAMRFDSMTSTNVLSTRVGMTGPGGVVTMRGLRAGFYEFKVNDPADGTGTIANNRWKPYPETGNTKRQLLMQSQKMDVALLPIETAMYLRVHGFDLVTFQPNQPLPHVEVELTGVVGENVNGQMVYRDVIPTRTAPTGKEGVLLGRVLFNKLPTIAYRITARRSGYQIYEGIIDPFTQGGLLPGASDAAPHIINMQYINTSFRVDVEHPFAVPTPVGNTLFQMEGLVGTKTEGIVRAVRTGWAGSGLDDREFTFLAPGRYRLTSQPLRTVLPFPIPGAENRPDPYLEADAVVEVGLGHPAMQGQQPEPYKLPVEVRPARIRIRAQLAEEDAATTGDVRPKFLPASNIQLDFVEADEPRRYDAARGMKSIILDDNGEGFLEIDPSAYAIFLPNDPDYDTWVDTSGIVSKLRNLSRAKADEKEVVAPISRDPENISRSQKLRLRSNDDYTLDLYVSKRFGAVSGSLISQNAPTPFELTRIAPTATVTLTDTVSGTQRTQPLIETDGGRGSYSFRNVFPGNYTVQVNLSDHFETPPAQTVNVPTWGVDRLVNHQRVVYKDRGLSFRYEMFELASPDSQDYVFSRRFTVPSLRVQADYAKGNVNLWGSGFPFGGFDYFLDFRIGLVNYHHNGRIEAGATGVQTIKIYLDGPLKNAVLGRNEQARDVTWKSYNIGDPTEAVPNVGFTLNNPLANPSNPLEEVMTGAEGNLTRTAWTGLLKPHSNALEPTTRHPNWAGADIETVLVDAANLVYEVHLKMKRAIRLEGRVIRTVDDKALGNIVGARVRLLDQFGVPELDIASDKDGKFEVVRANDPEPFFLEVARPGYQSYRKRFSSRDANPDPEDPKSGLIANLRVELQQLPLPEITATDLNRAGLFLPWVNQQGDQDNLGTATDALTMEWQVQATPATYSDQRDPLPNQSLTDRVDPIAEFWLIDPRVWSLTSLVNAMPEPIGDDISALFSDPLFPDAIGAGLAEDEVDPKVKLDFLTALNSGAEYLNATHVRVQAIAGEGQSHGTGTLPLWTLPPGEFYPIIAAVSEGGAVRFMRHNYGPEFTTDRLEGVKMEPWMANLLESIGMFSTLIKTNRMLEDNGLGLQEYPLSSEFFAPEGRYIPEPDFNVTIAQQEGDDRFVDYKYELLVQANEGMNATAGKILGMGPGFVGLSLTADATFTIDGFRKAAVCTIGGDVAIARDETDDDVKEQNDPKNKPRRGHPRFQRKRYVPKMFKGVRKEFPGFRFQKGTGVRLQTTFANFLREDRKLDWKMAAEVTGGMVGQASVDLSAFKKTNVVTALIDLVLGDYSPNITADIKAGLLARLATEWSSEVPKAFEPTGGDDQVARRHYFGGDESITISEDEGKPGAGFEAEMGMHLSAGATLTAGEFLTGGARLEFRGDPKRYPGNEILRSASVTLNTKADFPLITAMQGALGFTLTGEANLYVTKLQGSWEYDVINFHYPRLNTEPFFALSPFGVTKSYITNADMPEVTSTGASPQIFQALDGPFHLDTRSDRAGAFVDFDPVTNEAVLKFFSATGEDGKFKDPVEITRRSVIGELQTACTLNQWIVAWVDAEEGTGFGPTSIYHSRSSDDGLTWSSPERLHASDGILRNLRLIASKESEKVTLAFLETLGGPLSIKSTILGLNYANGTWSDILTLRERACVQHFNVIPGDPDDPTIGYLNEAGQFMVQQVNGGGPALSVGSDVIGPLSLGSDGGNRHALYVDASGQMNLSVNEGGAGWQSQGQLFNVQTATEVQSVYVPNGSILAAWLAGGGSRQIWVATVTSTGEPTLAPAEITRNIRGDYSDLQITPGGDDDAFITCRFTNSPGELRIFHVRVSTGEIIDHDYDGDGLPDHEELHIIDANSDDGIALIDDVDLNADFDGDGVPNGEEIRVGSSPINQLDTPNGAVLPTALQIVVFERLDDGRMRLVIGTEPGQSYLLEQSTDLSQFETVETMTANSATLEFVIPPSDLSKRFYRITGQ